MEKTALKALTMTLARVPQPARQAIFQRVPSPYGVTGVLAGARGEPGGRTRTRSRAATSSTSCHQGTGRRTRDGRAVHLALQRELVLNPLLVQVMVNGYMFNMYKGAPLLKKGGTMIVTHPCTDQFDKEHHAPYIEFVHNLLPETRDGLELHKRYEKKFRVGTRRTSRRSAADTRTTGSRVLHVVLGEAAVSTWPRDRRRRRQRVHPEADGLGDGAHDERGPRDGEGHRAGEPGHRDDALSADRHGRRHGLSGLLTRPARATTARGQPALRRLWALEGVRWRRVTPRIGARRSAGRTWAAAGSSTCGRSGRARARACARATVSTESPSFTML